MKMKMHKLKYNIQKKMKQKGDHLLKGHAQIAVNFGQRTEVALCFEERDEQFVDLY